MFIAMNRFQVADESIADFEAMWRGRESHLDGVPGFVSFALLQGPAGEGHRLYASHTHWQSRQAFEDWTRSEAFRKAHAGAGQTRIMYAGPPKLELFDAVEGTRKG